VDFFQSSHDLTDVIAQRIQEHILGIQERIAACEDSVFVINIENNLIFGAPNVKKYFEDHPMQFANTVQFIREEKPLPNTTIEGQTVVRAGSNTNTKTKPIMVEKLRRIIRGKALKVHKQCVQVCMEDQPDHLEGKKGIDTLTNQLSNMVCDIRRVDPNHVNSAIKRPSIIYRPENGVDLDDGFMSLAISIDGQRRALERVNVRNRTGR
jgi:acetolactate synthase regulatory subunit